MSVAGLPGFQDGMVSVQDEAAQLASNLLDTHDGAMVLDACAAPGGKSCHLKERHPDIELTARDIDPNRLAKVRENAERLGLTFNIDVAPIKPGPPKYDFILADAPCSGSGVIRRHPDIKTLRTREDLNQFHRQQVSILKGLWNELKPGGCLLYVTCSIFRQENDETIAAFQGLESSANSEALLVSWGEPTRFGRQLLPEIDGTDGLYYAKLSKAL
jgi:16S rRNA (cytosine967-C5)-methyltransferase